MGQNVGQPVASDGARRSCHEMRMQFGGEMSAHTTLGTLPIATVVLSKAVSLGHLRPPISH